MSSGERRGGPFEGIRRALQGLKLRHILFLFLFLSGIIPLAISSFLLIQRNRDLLVDREREYLVRRAEDLSTQLSGVLDSLEADLLQRGGGMLIPPGPDEVVTRLRQAWLVDYLSSFFGAHQEAVVLLALTPEGRGLTLPTDPLPESLSERLLEGFDEAIAGRGRSYRFARRESNGDPLAVLTVPVATAEGGAPVLVLQAVVHLELLSNEAARYSRDGATVLLVDRSGEILWSEGEDPELIDGVRGTELVDVAYQPLNYTRSFRARVAGREREIEAFGGQLGGSGWGAIVLQPKTVAFKAVDQMVYSTLLSTLLLIALSLISAVAVARWMGTPLDRLTDTTREIAAGNFSRRAAPEGLGSEMAELADNFNRMGEHVERYVEQLREAAKENRELFIGSIRAFAAAIDAKDPYTRGHSERVAAFSRTIAERLELDDEEVQRVWLGALLHDVGKIGVDDRILKSEGLLSDEDFDAMRQHPVIGVEIISRIGQLREVIPAIHWHHEDWNGQGYPDGLEGEDIPLQARIVAVADVFDAVTTKRPYQDPFTLESAVDTITRLTGSRLDAKVVTAFLKAYDEGEIERQMQQGTLPETAELQAEMRLLDPLTHS